MDGSAGVELAKTQASVEIMHALSLQKAAFGFPVMKSSIYIAEGDGIC